MSNADRFNLDDQATFWMVVGAGASTYPWYAGRFDIDEESLTLAVGIEHPDDERQVIERLVTPRTIRTAIRELDAAEHPGTSWIDWSDPEVDSDVDADTADQILQHIVLGKVVYG